MIRALFLMVTLVATRSQASQSIGYEQAPLYPIHPRLISQSVQLNEIPTKIIKITKTVAVKVPVPYPVKVPYHIPVPVPVHHPVAVPVPQIVKVPHHVPVPIERPVPVELPQQVPLYLTKPVALPHPVPVPQPIAIHKPVYYPLPHAVPYPSDSIHSNHHDHIGLFAKTSHFEGRDDVEENQYGSPSQRYDQEFRPSQPDYANAN